MSRKMQKALHLHLEEDKVTPKYRGKEYAVFEKYDGWYGYFDTEVGKIMSSAGREIPSMIGLSEYLKAKLYGGVGGRLIFEIMIEDTPFAILNGILNRKTIAHNAFIMVHDFVPTAEMDMPFKHRYDRLYDIIEPLNSDVVKRAPILLMSTDKQEWRRMARLMWSKDAEGIILKDVESHYAWGKRNASLMKIKEELTLDLMVVGMVEGEGKYKGTLGALQVMGQKRKIHTISGMTDEQRQVWWHSPPLIVGSVVEVKAMKVLDDGSLREPRFKHVRHEKGSTDVDDV
jgi:ATP-dependent DNA ligase